MRNPSSTNAVRVRAFSSRALPARFLAYTLSVLVFSGLLVVLPAPPARAATALTITPLNWDVIGLDSNKPQSSAITKFVQRFKVCNVDSSTTADGVKTTWTWGTGGSTKISLVNGTNTDGSATDRTIGSLVPGACAITSYNLDVATAPRSQSFPATPNTRPYTVGTSTTTAGFGSTTALSRRLYVQKLVSQSRNAIVSTSWSSVTDGTNPCSSATACTVHENEKYRVTMIGKTSTGYLQTEQILNIPDNVFEVLSIKTTFAIPGVTINSEYADACGWAAPPTTTSPGSCIGPPGVPGGKAGGNPIKTVYTLKALSNAATAGAVAMNPMILDNSGGSYHYNSDVATDAITITPVKSSDLSITKTHANAADSNAFIRNTSGTTSSGNRYVVTVTNNGPTATTGTITVADTLPTGLLTAAAIGTSVSGTGQGSLTWSCPAAGATTISCTTSGSLVSGGSATLTIPITVPSGQTKGQVTNTATVSIAAGASNSVDPKSSNNTASDPTTIADPPDADLILTNTHTGNFSRGGTATWNLSLKNDGPVAVTSPQVTSTLPTGVTYTGFTGTNWSCNASGQVVTCTYSAGLNSGITANSLAISGTVAASAGDTVTNVASATASGTDPNTANNTNISDTAVVGQADMSLSVSHAGNLTINSTGTFDFAVTNSGPDAANSPSLLFTLPPKMTYSSVNTTGWSCSGSPASPTTSESQVVTCSRTTALASGATSTVNVTVNIHSTATEGELFAIISGITCSGTVQSTTVGSQTVYSCPVVGGTGFTTYDPDTTNNYADDAANSYSPADMGVTATATASITAGNDITYTVTVTNNGPNSATNPFFALTLPNGVTFNATSPSNSNTLSNAYTSPATPTSQTAANFTTSCSYSEAEVVCPPSATTTLLSGQSFNAQIIGNTSATTTPGGGAAVVATASTGADQGDTNSANDTATASTTVTGGNVPPVVNFTGSPTTSVNESSSTTYTYNWTATDSTATVSSFVASCGAAGTKVGSDTITAGGTGTTSVSGSFVCKFDDGPTTSDVTVNATDDQALTATATTTVTVSNVAPTGTFNAPSSATTSSSFTVSITSPADVSATDTTSGFTYSFDCGSGTFSDFSTSTSLSCTAPSSAGSVQVNGKIRDKNGGITTYGPTTVNVISGAPVADAQSVATNEDTNKLITLTATDAQSDPLTYKVTSLPSNGKLYVGNATTDEITSGELPQTLPGTQVTFVPNTNYNNGANASGNTFQFKATDGTNESAAATITIDVDPVNDAPAAANTTITTSSGSATLNLVNITTDVETSSANHTFKITALPSEGTLKDGATTITSGALPYTMTNGTTVTYLQPANDTSDDSFTYSATDRGDPDNCGSVVAGQCTAAATDPGTVTIDVANAAPTATAQTATTNEDTVKTITLAGTDPEGDTLSFKVTGLASNGVLKDGATTITSGMLPRTLVGTLTYTPNADYNTSAAGSNDSFTFKANDGTADSTNGTVTLDVDPVNDDPAAADHSMTASTAGAASVNLASLASDLETTDGNLTYEITVNGSKGTASLSGSTLNYQQAADQTGTDTVTYRIIDRGDPDNCGSVVAGACTATESDTGTITVTLTNTAPTATAQSTSTNEDTSKLITLAGTDAQGDTLTFKITSLPANGKLYKGNSTAAQDEITSASSGSPVTLSGTQVTFVPNANHNNGSGVSGNTFNFTVTDASGSNTTSSAATVTVDVDPINDTPAAADSTMTTSSGSATINLVNITTDVETSSANHTYKITALPSAGTLKDGATTITSGMLPYTMTNGTTVTYLQPANDTSDDSFVYSATDRGDNDNCGSVVAGECTAALTDAGTITIDVTNAGPTATGQTGGSKVPVAEDGSVLITLAGTDPEGDTLTFKVTSVPANGKLYKGGSTAAEDEITSATALSPVTLAGATVTFVPTANYNNGSDAFGPNFTFTATDASGSNTTSSAATVQIDVNPANDAPTWDASISVASTATLDLRTVSADQETADDNLSYALVDDGSKGTASLSGTNNRTLSYVKDSGQTGTDTVTVAVTDRGDPENCGSVVAGSCTATTTVNKNITITLDNTGPTATAQSTSTNEDTNKLITLAGTEPDGDTLTFKVTSLPPNGKLYVGNATSDEITSGELPQTLPGAQVTFVPNANYNNGSGASGNTFNFSVTDVSASNTTSSATVTIDVDPINDDPVADDTSLTTSSSGATSVNLAALAADQETADGDLTYAIVTNGSKGTASLSGSTLSYQQAVDKTGTDTVTYRITDRGDPDNCGSVVAGACTATKNDTGTITITLTNTGPTATAQSTSTNEDTSKLITLAGTDPQGDTLTFKVTSLPSNGKLYVGNATSDEITSGELPQSLPAAQVTFVPNANYNNGSGASGNTFNFTATDASGSNIASSVSTVTIDVDPVNDAPTWDSSVSMNATSTLDLRTVTADQETVDDNLSFSIVSNGSKGTAALSGTNNRTLSYTANSGAVGSDNVTIRVTDRGDPDNCGAVVSGACTATQTADKSVTINLGSNVAPTASVSLHTLPNTGAAAVLTTTQAPKTNDKVRATATCGDSDGDAVTLTFVWKIQRVGPPVTTETVQTTTVSAGSCSGSFTDTLDLSKTGFGDKGETVKVEVTPNDGKVNGTVASGSTTVVVTDTPPTATDRIVKMGVNQTESVVLEGSDVDGESVNFTITQQPANGNVTLAANSTKNCFTANGTSGTRGSYTSPGTETCHLNASYTPASGVTGTVTFKYKVENSDAVSRIATVTVEIQANPETGTQQTDDAEQETVQGALVTTGSAPSTDDPVETQIVAARNGRIIIREEPVDETPPSGFSFFAQQIDIQVLDGNDDPVTTTASEPQRFTFLLDPSMLPSGKTVADIEIYRNGTKVPACTGGSNLVQPTPACVLSRTLASGIIQIEVLTTAASTWHFAFPVAPSGGGGGGGSTPTPPVATGQTDRRVYSPNGDRKFDRVVFSGEISEPVDWTLEFLDSPTDQSPLFTTTGVRGTAPVVDWDPSGRVGEGTYWWRLTGTDAEGLSFDPVLGTIEVDLTPPPVTRYRLQADDGTLRIDFAVGEASTVEVTIECSGDVVKRFAPAEVGAGGGKVRRVWHTTGAMVRRLREQGCDTVVDAEDVVANDKAYSFSQESHLPGPLIRLFVDHPTPVRGTVITFRTRLEYCSGHRFDKVELWRRVGSRFRKLAETRFDGDCKARFRVKADFDRAEFRTIWPKQDDDHRRGRAEPVLVATRLS